MIKKFRNKKKIIEEKFEEKIEICRFKDKFQDYFLNFSYNLLDRTFPDIRDGLKNVQRRILYSMYKNSLNYSKSVKTSAKTIGDVVGKYHPHGETSVYEALVRLSQTFVMNRPLVFGQGNFGSVDGDEAASPRYTQCKLSKVSGELINDKMNRIN